jgi:hypothetical protein
MVTKILHNEGAEKAKFTGLLDYKSEYSVLLPVNFNKNGKIEVFDQSFKLGYSG